MKTITSMLPLVLGLAGAGFLLTSAASILTLRYAPHRFSDLSAPALWTSGPVRVDPATQHYERLSPSYSSYVVDASNLQPVEQNVAITAGNRDPALPQPATMGSLASCASRYQSFDPATNRYRAYDGQLRTCPSTEPPAVATSTASSQLQADVARCSARYRSYRAADNTYQPYNGGPRRLCLQQSDVADARTTP